MPVPRACAPTSSCRNILIRFGILGAARIAPRALIYPCMDEPRAQVSAVAARVPERAAEFARQHAIALALDSYDALIAHPAVDAVYIPLPISAHCEWTLRALAAGKHVLCEKSFASNAGEAERMAAAARASGCIAMDAFHYRYHPLFLRAREIVASGLLGTLDTIEAVFRAPVANPGDIRLDYRLGGGVTMDIGCYPISWVRHITAEEPSVLDARAETGSPEVDLVLSATLALPGGARARIVGDMRPDCLFDASLTVTGSDGRMHLYNPLLPQTGHRLELSARGDSTIEVFDRRSTYGYQLDAFLDAVECDMPPLTDADDAVRQMRVVDACYQAAGLRPRGSFSG